MELLEKLKEKFSEEDLEFRIVNEFKGLINNVEITDKKNYYSILYILEQIENKFGEYYTNEFIKI